MKSCSTHNFKILKGYENYSLNANIPYDEFLNLNSDKDILQDLYTAFNISKTNCATIEPNWYKQIFLEFVDNNKTLYLMTISYSTSTSKFRVEITDMQANRVHNNNDDIFKLSTTTLEPSKWLFNELVKNGLFFVFDRCKEIKESR